jgi:hypothetical protein
VRSHWQVIGDLSDSATLFGQFSRLSPSAALGAGCSWTGIAPGEQKNAQITVSSLYRKRIMGNAHKVHKAHISKAFSVFDLTFAAGTASFDLLCNFQNNISIPHRLNDLRNRQKCIVFLSGRKAPFLDLTSV